MPVDPTALINLAIVALPEIIDLIRGRTPPGTTDDQIKAALSSAIVSSLVVDDAWLAAHPPTPPAPPEP